MAIEVTTNDTFEQWRVKTNQIGLIVDSTVSIVQSIPSSVNDSGTKGNIAFDSTHLYVCIDTNLWRRISLSSW